MKKLMFALAASAAMLSYAEENKELEQQEAPIFWGFGNVGIYSGYQLYGSLLNSEPVIQHYTEVNANLAFKDWDFGYLGIGLWCNSDLTKKRNASYGRIFNETDPNIHWGKTFWFDDDRTWGLDYRCSFIWYYYPHHLYQKKDQFDNNGRLRKGTATTMDFNHSFALINPFVTPFFTWVHEYHENNADLWEFGLKRTFAITDALTITPSITGVIRDHRYNWCFATHGFQEFHNGGWATLKYMIEANYQLCANFGLFAKFAMCETVDSSLRDAAEHSSGAEYGKYKDFAWGAVGVTFNF